MDHAVGNADRVVVPVLALHGELGQQHHRAGTQVLAELLPNATVRPVPGARHFGPNTHPGVVAAMVGELIAAL